MVSGKWGRLRPKARAIAAALFVLVPPGCGESELAGTDSSCSSDEDCASGEHCARQEGPPRQPMIAIPCPPGGTPCTADSECPSGSICETASLDGKTNCGKICEPGCTAESCPTHQVCENARCRDRRCDEPDGPVCAEHWRCDPAATANEPLVNEGSRESDSANPSIRVGCVRVKCNETNGFTCEDQNGGWVCDPENTTDGSGCRAVPCEQSLTCSDDSNFICTPSSSNPRPGGVDPHGCVRRNCEEGVECMIFAAFSGTNVGYCNFASPFADELGCAPRPCNETGTGCLMLEVCDPSSQSNRFGCRSGTCVEGAPCLDGWHCDPNSTAPDGCVQDGAGGANGSGGSAGQGASGFAGAVGDGRCVKD